MRQKHHHKRRWKENQRNHYEALARWGSYREDYLRLLQIAEGSTEIILDFGGVEILTPTYADELFHSLGEKFGTSNIKAINQETALVKDTLNAVAGK